MQLSLLSASIRRGLAQASKGVGRLADEAFNELEQEEKPGGGQISSKAGPFTTLRSGRDGDLGL
jgi:hypothetical protein